MQQYKLEISPIAQEDILKADGYYLDKVGIDVAIKFENELTFAFNQIKINPYYEKKGSTFRSFPMKKFPYIIMFNVYEERKVVRILSIFHTSQNPEKYP